MARINQLSIILPNEKTSVSAVISYGNDVKSGMTAHAATFPDPLPSMEDFSTALENLTTANNVASDKKNNETNQLLKKRKIDFINHMLKPLSIYVLYIAKGNRYTAGLSGFVLNKEETSSQPPGPFTAVFEGVGPNDGTAWVRIENRAGNLYYEIERKINDQWVIIKTSSELRFLVANLPAGTTILRITGKKGEMSSPPFELVVKAI